MFKYRNITYHIKLIIISLIALTLLFGFRVNTILLGALVLTWIIEGDYRSKFNLLYKRKVYLIYLILFSVYLLSMIYSDNLREAWENIETKLVLLFLPLIFGSFNIKNIKSINRILICYIIGIIVAILVCYIYATYQYYHNQIWTAFSIYRFPNILHIHRASFSLAIAFSIILVLEFILKKETKTLVKIVLFLIMGLLLYTIVILGARVPALALPIAINIMLFVYIFSRGKVLKSILIVLGINLLIGAIVIFALDNVLVDRFLSMQGDARIEIWSNIPDLIKSNFIFGYGIGDAKEILVQKYSENGFEFLQEQEFNAHNQYLQIWLETGIIGLLILLVNLILPFYKAIKLKDFATMSFVVLISICFLSEVYLNRFNGILFYSFLLNILSLRFYVFKE